MNIKDDFILKELNEGYLVGGAVRDFGKKEICDRDISIKDAYDFAQRMAEKFNGTLVTLDEENKIFRVVLKDKRNYLDISEMRGSSIEDDLMERDFSINAIAYDLKNETFIDVTGGIEDLKHGILRHIKEENFEADPLRVLRAYRFASVTGFTMTEELKSAIKKYLHLSLNPAPERITYEIMKLMGGDYASETIMEMDNVGLLKKLYPCVNEMKLVPPNTHHHLGLFYHAIETVRQIEILYKEAESEIQEHLNSIDFGGFPRINHLKLAGFLHDIGKYSTWTIEECGRHRFIKHDDVGSKMAIELLKSQKFSKKQIEYISGMIKYHIYPSGVIAAPDLNEKVMMRYIRKMENNVIDNIILAKADRLSARGVEVTEEMVASNINGLNKLLKFYLEKKESLKPLPKLLSGTEISDITGIGPSPKLGLIVKELHEAQINGEVNTVDEALNFVKNFVKTKIN